MDGDKHRTILEENLFEAAKDNRQLGLGKVRYLPSSRTMTPAI